MIALSFALPEESKELVARCSDVRKSGARELPQIFGRFGAQEIAIFHTGMGMARARMAAERFLANCEPEMLISAGFAGGLDPRLGVGDGVLAENFSDEKLREKAKRVFANGEPLLLLSGDLFTAEIVLESVEEKRALFEKTGALAVDMETRAIHEVCTARGVPMLSLRAISDAANCAFPLPQAVWFDDARQRPRPFSLVIYLLLHPAKIASFASFVAGIGVARRSLTDLLCRFLRDGG